MHRINLLLIIAATFGAYGPPALAQSPRRAFVTTLEDQDTCTYYPARRALSCWHNLQKRNVTYPASYPEQQTTAGVIRWMKDFSFRLIRGSPDDALVFKRVFETEE